MGLVLSGICFKDGKGQFTTIVGAPRSPGLVSAYSGLAANECVYNNSGMVLGGSPMKISRIVDLHADAGWRVFSFLKIETDAGLIGWSEYNESYGSKGLTAVIMMPAEMLLATPSPGRTHHLEPLCAHASGAGRAYPASDRGDRERAR